MSSFATQFSMIESLISSKTRIKLLLKFFLNSATQSYLRNLEAEFGESSNAIRLELNKLEQAGMLNTEQKGNKKWFTANTKHPLFKDINSIIHKYIGLDWIVEYVVSGLGDVHKIYLIGDLAKGTNSKVIEIAVIGNVNEVFLKEICTKLEKKITRKVNYQILDRIDKNTPSLLLWSNVLKKEQIIT